MSEKVISRFLAKVNKDAPNGCWEWTASTFYNGYGQTSFEGRSRLAHRVSYLLFKGEIGDSYCCHTCDNRLCVNPDHLFLGSPQDNMDDMIGKGRAKALKGEDHKRSKLTDEIVRSIRTLWNRDTIKQGRLDRLCLAFPDIDKRHIKKIVYGQSWKHITV